MSDAECVAFLQWALPRLGLRWAGFRRVRRQVCKRLGRRLVALGLADLDAYRARLEAEAGEWRALDALCRITVSRFWRDRGVFERLRHEVLPGLAAAAAARGAVVLRCWSAGAASGEEPYSLSILWRLALAPRFSGLDLEVIATEVDPHLLGRARDALYGASSLEDLPPGWRARAFAPEDGRWRLRPGFREGVAFARQDIRRRMPAGPFDLVLCRNLAFTYFDEAGQRRVLRRLARRLRPGGALVLGAHERLPEPCADFEPWAPNLPIYRRR